MRHLLSKGFGGFRLLVCSYKVSMSKPLLHFSDGQRSELKGHGPFEDTNDIGHICSIYMRLVCAIPTVMAKVLHGAISFAAVSTSKRQPL